MNYELNGDEVLKVDEILTPTQTVISKTHIGLLNQVKVISETDTQLTYQWQKFNLEIGIYEDDTTNITPINGVIPINGQAIIEKAVVIPKPSLEEQIAQLQQDNAQLKSDNLTIMEVLATIYEGMLEKGTV